jgi:hypothetical protein
MHHSRFRPGGTSWKWCSTPFGITACTTICEQYRPTFCASAQRLSASLHAPRAICCGSSTAFRVLNAFRHHCMHHRVPGCMRRERSLSAQRLSASLHAPQWSPAERRRMDACSTPFGITACTTRRDQPAHQEGEGAQRLSASLHAPPLWTQLSPASAFVSPPFTHPLSAMVRCLQRPR